MLMTAGEITGLISVPCIFLPVILLAISYHLGDSVAFYLLVVQSNYLVHVNKCVNFLLTNNVLCLVVLMWGNFISNFSEMLYQGEHVGQVSGRYSDVMSEELLLNINHRLASNSFMLSPGLSVLGAVQVT